MPALAGGQQHHAAGLADRERRAHVGAEVELLDRHRVGPVARRAARPTRAWIARQPRAGVAARRGVSTTPPSSATRRPPLARDDAVAGVGDARIDAEDDHVTRGILRGAAGRLPARAAQAPGSEEPAKREEPDRRRARARRRRR